MSSSSPMTARSQLQPKSMSHLSSSHAYFRLTCRCRNAKKFSETTDAYSLNVAKYPAAKEHFKIDKVPTAIVYKDGKEIKRVDEMGPESMKEVEQILLS